MSPTLTCFHIGSFSPLCCCCCCDSNVRWKLLVISKSKPICQLLWFTAKQVSHIPYPGAYINMDRLKSSVTCLTIRFSNARFSLTASAVNKSWDEDARTGDVGFSSLSFFLILLLLPVKDHRKRFIKGRANPGRCVSPPAWSAISSNAVIVGLTVAAGDDDVVVGLDTDVLGKMVAAELDPLSSSSSSSSLSESLSRLTGWIYSILLINRSFGDVVNGNVPFDPIFLWPSVHLNPSMPPVQSRILDIQIDDQGSVPV